VSDGTEPQPDLLKLLASQPVPTADTPRAQLERLLPADELQRLDELILADVLAEARTGGPTFLEHVEASKATSRRAFMDAVLGRSRAPGETGGGGFDGGARDDQPRRVETHAETLTRVLASGEADVGADF
jgi:hypothetical protein